MAGPFACAHQSLPSWQSEGGRPDVVTFLERRAGRASAVCGGLWRAGVLGAPCRVSLALRRQAGAFSEEAPSERSMLGK